MSNRNFYKYKFRVGHTVEHGGITKDPERREEEHQQEHPTGKLTVVGRKTTEEAARKWEKDNGFT